MAWAQAAPHSRAALDRDPWYADFELRLPLHHDSASVERLAGIFLQELRDAGVQLLNVALGGTLRPVLHGRGPCQRHVHPHNPQHPLETLPGSLLAQVYSQPSELVNSMHEYAVDEPAVGFRVTARGPASVVEAIESESDDWLAVGVQFPPEPRAADLELRLLGAFLNKFRSQTQQPAYEDSACL